MRDDHLKKLSHVYFGALLKKYYEEEREQDESFTIKKSHWIQ